MRMRGWLPGIVLLAAVPLLAAEFWEKKTFPEWNRNEVRRMLTRSPWARQITTSLDRPGLPSPNVSPVPMGGGFPGAGPGSPVGGTTAGAPQAPGSEPFGGDLHRIIVRWQSALPVRQALVRSSVPGGASAKPA